MIVRMHWKDGEGGCWITPLICFSWKPHVFSIWFAWIYWMWQIDFSGGKNTAPVQPTTSGTANAFIKLVNKWGADNGINTICLEEYLNAEINK